MYKKLHSPDRSPGRPNFVLAAGMLLLVAAMLPAFAIDVPTLYTADVIVDQESDNPREDAYKAALVEVLTRVSGAELAGNEAAIDEMFPVPSAYVTQFRPGAANSLRVAFDGAAIERVLRANGQLVWGRERPLTLVWLAVDWGQGEREIIGAGDKDRPSRTIDRNQLLRERVLEIGEKRGLPLAFPLLDTTDLQSVTFSDVFGGFEDRVIAASRRYDVDSILIGRVRATGGERNRWTYIFGDNQWSWTGPPETVVAQVADVLAAEFAVGGNAPLERVALNVSGVQSVDSYGSLSAILAGVSVIEAFTVASVAGDIVTFEIDVRGGADRLRRALRFAGLLEEDAGFRDPGLQPPGASQSLNFFYGPEDAVSSSPNVP